MFDWSVKQTYIVTSWYNADLSDLNDVKLLAKNISKDHKDIDVIINNAGIYKTTNPITKDGIDTLI